MDNHFFLNTLLPSSSSSNSSSPIQCPSHHHQDPFFNPPSSSSSSSIIPPNHPHHHHHHHHPLQFDSSTSDLSNDHFLIREFINKLGSNNNNNINIPPLMKPIGGLNSSTVADFSADPGFAERAAKFSCFGSRSFNGRTINNNTNIINSNNDNGELLGQRSVPPLMQNGKISRVSSTPSLKALGSHQNMENNNINKISSSSCSPLHSQDDQSSISDQIPNGELSGFLNKPSPDVNSRKRKASSKSKPKENPTSPNPPKGGEANGDLNAKRSKPNEAEGLEKAKEESNNAEGNEKQNTKNANSNDNNNSNKLAEPPKDYIHVRARRGQATDSHSLAERVRREKISERMKLLQDLVPGCNKVTGKALMLDEIINYVQSLQRQVEFLSMKLASVNTRADDDDMTMMSIDNLVSKDIFQSNPSAPIFASESTAFYGQNSVIPNASVESLDIALFAMHLPPLNAFNQSPSHPQYPMSFCEDDLHTIVQMGFGQTENGKMPTQYPTFNGSSQLPNMKLSSNHHSLRLN